MSEYGLPDADIPRRDLWYIAGPFFNPAQVAVIESIEQAFVAADVAAFSPRLCDENKKGPPTPEGAAVIFDRNVKGLLKCSHLLAVLDWKLQEGYQIRVGRQRDESWQPLVEVGPLNIPDSGTVFEMGAAHMKTLLADKFTKLCGVDPLRLMSMLHQAVQDTSLGEDFDEFRTAFVSLLASLRQMPTVIYTERAPTDSINLMLTMGAKGVLNGPLALKQFLNKGDLDWNALRPWTGGNR